MVRSQQEGAVKREEEGAWRMPRAGERDLAKENQWRDIFADWKSSGLSAFQYCQEKDIKLPLFYEWRRKISKLDAQAKRAMSREKAKSPQPAPRQTAKAASFAEVQVVERPRQLIEDAKSTMLEIAFPRGIKILVGENCSLQLLSSVINLLENC